jgi:hypothetical protein
MVQLDYFVGRRTRALTWTLGGKRSFAAPSSGVGGAAKIVIKEVDLYLVVGQV